MGITVPPNYTPVHKQEVQDEASMTEESARKIVQNSNWLLELRPIRSIVFIEVNQDGVPNIDLSRWQEANGGEITNPNSPIRSVGATLRFTPNYEDRYPRVTTSAAGPNGTGGSQTHDLEHDHGGLTGGVSPTPGASLEIGGDRRAHVEHMHTIADDLADGTFLDAPQFLKVIAYMRIV